MEPTFSVALLIVIVVKVLVAELKVAVSPLAVPVVAPGKVPTPVPQLFSVVVTQLASVAVALHTPPGVAKRWLDEPKTSEARRVATDTPRKERRFVWRPERSFNERLT